MADRLLPPEFSDLEPFAAAWCIAHEPDRYAKRLASTMDEIQAFYDAVFPHAYSFEQGMMHPGNTPGLGVDLDEALAASFPYAPAYLPTARLLDGTVHSW